MATVSDVMTREVRSLVTTDTLVQAAQAMHELNVGAIPVCDGERIVGIVTDRDIVVRGLAFERDATATRLVDVMSSKVETVREDQNLDDVLEQMAKGQIRRMPVVDGQQCLVGIVSLGDIATRSVSEERDVGVSLREISETATPVA